MSHVPRRASPARLLPISFAAIAVGIAAPAPAQESPPTPVAEAAAGEREVTLPELLSYAERHAPAVQVAMRRRGHADAARRGADPRLRENPTMEFGIGPRFGQASDRDFDFFASLGQPVEIAGERGLRLDAASRLGEQLDAETTATRWEVRREAILAYRSAVVARERVAIADRIVAFTEEMLVIARRRLAAGDATGIDVRVAETELAQARQAKLAAGQDLMTARIRLAEVTGWPIDTPPSVPAGLGAPRAVPTLAAVMEVAQDRHPELRARQAAVAEAQARVELADREAWPAPVFGALVAREGSAGSPANYIVLGTLGLPLPFWQLNQAERARARVDVDVARAEESATARALRARIARAHAEVASASERLSLFTSTVAPQLENNLALLRRGFDAGEIPLLNVAVARDQFLAALRDALIAYADYYRAHAELEFAVGAELPGATSDAKTGGVP
jgi:cobalt-zinc-cadmium efflux system outer membrane protein